MAFEKHYTAKQAAEAVLKKTQELLSKSELVKAETGHEKGVNRAGAGVSAAGHKATISSGNAGHSAAGHQARHLQSYKQMGAGSDNFNVKNTKANTANAHKRTLKEMSRMPKPNLPKSEEGIQKYEELKLSLIKSGMSPNDVQTQLAKYETENSKELGYKLPEAGKHEKESERTDADYKVEPSCPHNAAGPESPASHSHPEVQKSEQDRLRPQADPQKNPKEQAEGNNELAGTTPTQVGQDGKNLPGYDEMKGHLKLAKFIGRMEHKRTKAAPAAGAPAPKLPV